MLERAWTVVTAHKKALLVTLLILFLLILGIALSREEQTAPEKPAVMTQEETWETERLRAELELSNANANALQKRLAEVQAAQRAPSTTYYVTAPTVEQAAAVVEKEIREDAPTLPRAAREKSDRTVVTPITKDEDGKDLPAERQKVDVYKINLRKALRIKAGTSVIDGKPLMSIGYEQGRFEALAHFDGSRCKGVTVMYNVAEW